jgi:hypothetical protein
MEHSPSKYYGPSYPLSIITQQIPRLKHLNPEDVGSIFLKERKSMLDMHYEKQSI